MTKDFDDTNWKQEILGSLEFNQSKFASKLLKNGAKQEDNSITKVIGIQSRTEE